MRKETPGLHSALNADMGYISGNSILFQIRSNLRFDYFTKGDHVFLVTQRQRGSADRLLVNKGFTHLRGVKMLLPRLQIEGFLQWEFDEFINLDDRRLAGGGMRIRWKDNPLQIISGAGAMWEREQIDIGDQASRPPGYGDITNLIRSTNYLVVRWQLDEILTLFSTTYYQVALRRFSDYRILWESRLGFAITKRLSLTVNLNFRYDNEPPAGVKSYDLEITNGVSYRI